ncbi:MAG: hypothetical protein ACLRRJ_05060 [Clostridium sp.]
MTQILGAFQIRSVAGVVLIIAGGSYKQPGCILVHPDRRHLKRCMAL